MDRYEKRKAYEEILKQQASQPERGGFDEQKILSEFWEIFKEGIEGINNIPTD